MVNIFLFIHVVIALLLIAIILLQKTGVDSISGLGGSNMSIISARAANSFLVRTTAVLAAAFMINSLVLANLLTVKSRNELSPALITSQELPIAK